MSDPSQYIHDPSFDAQLRGRFLRPAIAVLAFAFLALAAVVWLAAERQNRLAASQMRQVVDSLARQQLTDLERLTLDYSWWDASVEKLVLNLDPTWADENVGKYLTEMMGVSLTLVLGPSGEYVYGALRGEQVAALPPDHDLSSLDAGIAAARKVDLKAPRATAAFVRIGPKIYAVAVSPITPEANSTLTVPRSGSVLVLARTINEDLLGTLGRDFQIASFGLDLDVRASEDSMILSDFAANPIGRLTWSAPQPGANWIEIAIPGLTLLFMLMCALGWRVYAVWREALGRLSLKETSLRAAKEEAEASNRVKTAFLANVSHELRTPLNAIIGFSSIMSDQMLGPIGSPKYLSYAKDIQRTSRHLMAIINEILDLSTIESTRNVLNVSSFQIADATAEGVRLASAEFHNVRFVDQARPDANRLLRADRGKIVQILTNLLTNAAKASPPGGEVILQREVAEDRRYCIRIIDQGPGIDENAARVLFTPFARGASPYNNAAGGYGIGLAVSKRLAELHGAELTLKSNTPGPGSTATLLIPAERVMVSAVAGIA